MSDQSFGSEKEYYVLFETVNKYDERLITIKSWSVTLSLAALGSGFQFQHYGLFLVSCISGFGFWIIDTLMKQHQMRYYVRMREIEVFVAKKSSSEKSSMSTPQIDWSWSQAPQYFKGMPPSRPQWYTGKYGRRGYLFSAMLGHVALPHIINIIAGAVFFILGLHGILGNMTW